MENYLETERKKLIPYRIHTSKNNQTLIEHTLRLVSLPIAVIKTVENNNTQHVHQLCSSPIQQEPVEMRWINR